MDEISCKLTVFFEDPFWVGVFEQSLDGQMQVAKVTFGTEPSDQMVLQWILRQFHLLVFSPAVAIKARPKAMRFKRRMRLARQESQAKGVGTKAMQAISKQHEARKNQQTALARQEHLRKAAKKYALKQQKRKEKHRGH